VTWKASAKVAACNPAGRPARRSLLTDMCVT
jgi:hypothetical protein